MLAIWWSFVALAAGVALIRAKSGVAMSAHLELGFTGILCLGTFVVLFINTARSQINYQQLARDIEAEHPELHAALLTAVDQQPDPRQ